MKSRLDFTYGAEGREKTNSGSFHIYTNLLLLFFPPCHFLRQITPAEEEEEEEEGEEQPQ